MGKAKELAELGDKLTVTGSAVTVSGFNYDNIVDSAPGALNTLNELAAAIGDDANFSTTITNSIATKLPLAGGSLSGGLTVSGTVAATAVTGDGSGLTGLPASVGGANGVTFNDNVKAQFGTGNDLQLYHNSSNSYIENTTGEFFIKQNVNNNSIRFQVNASNNVTSDYLILEGSSGEVKIRHYGSDKLHTKSYGIQVYGNVVVPGTVDGRDVAADGIKLDAVETSVTTAELDLSAITKSIADTASDVFVYDTRKDSDGGAWRKRTQNTSWYNETLNTAKRGSRKEFPAVAVISIENQKLTIYDGDDPDMPMWIIFDCNAEDMIGGINASGGSWLKRATMINGELHIASISGYAPYYFSVNFISDKARMIDHINQYFMNGNISLSLIHI